jgi:hypothetical protein
LTSIISDSESDIEAEENGGPSTAVTVSAANQPKNSSTNTSREDGRANRYKWVKRHGDGDGAPTAAFSKAIQSLR